MHEIVKYFILTEIQEQCLNPMPEPLIGPGRPAEYRSRSRRGGKTISRVGEVDDALRMPHPPAGLLKAALAAAIASSTALAASATAAPHVHVLSTICGKEYVVKTLPMLRSMVWHSTTPLTMHIIADRPGARCMDVSRGALLCCAP